MARRKKENPRAMVDGIRRTADLKRWEAAIFTGNYDEDKKPIYEWITGDTEKDIKEKRNKIKYQIDNGIYVNPSEATLGEYLDEWIELHKMNIAETTYELYKMYIRVHIKPVIGDYKLNKIIPMTLKMFYKNRMETSREVKTKKGLVNKYPPLSSNSIRKLHTLLHEALNEAVMNNLILSNPANKVEPPKKEKYRPTILDADNYFKLIDFIKGTEDEIYVILAGSLGLRRGEVLGLTWQDVDFKNKTITIRQSITRFTKDVVKKPKNEPSFRTLVVPGFVLSILEEYKKSKKVVSLSGRICDKYKPQSYSKHFKALLEKYDIPHVRFHDLRHFTAIILLKKGVPDKIVADFLGHAQVATLQEIYQHVIKEMKDSLANTMDSFLVNRN